MGGNLLVVLIEVVNWLIRYAWGDGAVVPRLEMIYRHRVGISEEP